MRKAPMADLAKPDWTPAEGSAGLDGLEASRGGLGVGGNREIRPSAGGGIEDCPLKKGAPTTCSTEGIGS